MAAIALVADDASWPEPPVAVAVAADGAELEEAPVKAPGLQPAMVTAAAQPTIMASGRMARAGTREPCA
jgi:hypothetical protein